MGTSASSPGQVISLPQGGGAIAGIGESFSPDLHTGTGNLSVPISLPQGRNGLQPSLTLGYSTGAANGPFGLGWSLAVPAITRKTSRGVPIYDDARDTFILSGAEDLVPVASPETGVTLYRPRTEGLFAHIAHITLDGADYWRVASKDGLVSIYGSPEPGSTMASIVAPGSDSRPRRFSWQLTRTIDPFDNVIDYTWQRDTSRRDAQRDWDQLYLAGIRYADHGDPANPSFLVHVELDYGPRPDPFSDYRGGFEIRTTQRCEQIRISTHADVDAHVRTYRFTYRDQRDDPANARAGNGASLLSLIETIGHDGATTQTLPPLEFTWSTFEPEGRRYAPIRAPHGAMPPSALDKPDYELVDLFGNGLPSVLEMSGTARTWRNHGNGTLGAPRQMQSAPAGVRLADPGVQMLDADGDGRVDLMLTDGARAGYYPLTHAGAWDLTGYVPYRAAPSVALDDPAVRMVDLDGDGITDALRTGTTLECFFNAGRSGWTRVEARARRGLADFPDVSFTDPRVKLADMNGDGLQDIVLVNNGRIDYWPSLGHGRWAARITTRNSPRLSDATAGDGIGYDPRRLLLADVDGDGVADAVYIGWDSVTVWLGQSGNGWSDPITVHGTPAITNMDAVRVVDMDGTGTAGILWTYDAGTQRESTWKFLDLTGGRKPYLLVGIDNHRGSQTRIAYESSTRHYLADEADPATRWRTSLPFPVQVVARVEALDAISGGKLTTEYRYHHGYWDGVEREFRGFGMVEQYDTESFPDYDAQGLHGDAAFTPVPRRRFAPPTMTRTWFHQGPVGSADDWTVPDLAATPWPGDPAALDDDASTTAMLAGLSPRERRHAVRSLRGRPLRSELYALDETARETTPQAVTEHRYGIRHVPSLDPNRPGVYFPHAVATRTTTWERGTDPMTRVELTGDYDAYGQPRSRTSIAVPRGRNFRHNAAAGAPYLATHAATDYAVPTSPDAERLIVDRPARATTWEIVNDGSATLAALAAAIRDGSADRTLIQQSLTWYDGAPFEGLPLGRVGEHGAAVRSESLVLTDAQIQEAFGASTGRPPWLDPANAGDWPPEYPEAFRDGVPAGAGYVARELDDGTTGWFAITICRRYDVHGDVPQGDRAYGLVLEQRDALGNPSTTAYDAYRVLPVQVTDAVGLVTTAEIDYRVLAPRAVTDPNGARTEARFTPLGMVAAVSSIGPSGEGDTADAPGSSFIYDLAAFRLRGQPLSIRTVRRVHHAADASVAAPERDETITTVEYSDGFGRLMQARAQAEDLVFGDDVLGDSGLPADQSQPGGDAVGRVATGEPRVVVSGWKVYDNKGRVVEQFEPSFATGFAYEVPTATTLSRLQRVRTFYDAQGRVERTVAPDGAEHRTVRGVPVSINNPSEFDPTPWETFSYDANDNAGRTHAGTNGAPQSHWNTPSSVVVDALGRAALAIVRNGPDPATDWYASSTTYDIRGNALAVTDPLGRVAVRTIYDLANQLLRAESIDAGTGWTLRDAAGREIEQRDARGALVLNAYDALGRLTHRWARDDANDTVRLRERHVYGDDPSNDRANARAAGLLGRPWKQYDEAGLVTFARYDFKGNLLEKTRQVIRDDTLLAAFDGAAALGWRVDPFRVDWTPASGQDFDQRAATLLEPEIFTANSAYDALNRIRELRHPTDSTGKRRVIRPSYNRAGNLEAVSLEGSDGASVSHIAYNARGQRLMVVYANGVMTRHAYDDRTGRLLRTRSDRYTVPAPNTYRPGGQPLHDYGYVYDLVGNVTTLRDRTPGSGVSGGVAMTPPTSPTPAPADSVALRPPTRPQLPTLRDTGDQGSRSSADSAILPPLPDDGGIIVAPLPDTGTVTPAGADALDRIFSYDPIYRLVAATGRECDSAPPPPPWSDQPRCRDVTRAVAYTEHYRYDAAGNLLELRHTGANSGFTRTVSLAPASNRLQGVTVGSDSYGYACDAAGNLVQEATSRHFGWDQASRMRVFRVQVEASGSTPANPRWSEPSVYAQYLYDAAGQRVKKLVRKQGGGYDVAIWIDGGFEVRRSVRAGGTTENRTLHVMDGAKRIALVRTGPALSGDPRPAVTYEVADHLGGSNVVLDAAGTLIDREEYTPYGETSFGSTPLKRYRFTGKERDEESGLSYHGARYYAPWLARWTSPDPVGMIDGPILFAYPANPLRLVDPSGTAGEQPQLHLIQQSELRQPVTATAAGPGFGQPLRQTYQNLGAQWGMSNVHVGHPENMPFALTPAGTTTSVYAQEGGENMSLGASEEKARVQEARANNQFTREKGVDLSAKKGTRYGQPPLVEKLRDVRAPTPGANPKPPVPTPTVQATASASPAQAPAQLSLDFESPKMPASASTPDATTSTAPGASITATVPPSPGKGAAVMGVAKSLAKSLIPGAEYYDELKLAGGGSALLGLKAGISYSWMQVSAAAARASAAVAPILEGAANVGSRLTAPFLIIVDPRLIDPSLGGSSPYGPPPMT